MSIISAIKRFFRADGLLNKTFLGLFIANGVVSYYNALVLNCSIKNCGGLSGVKFWFAINLALFLAHFCFWVRGESEEFSRFFLFRAFCVTLSFIGHLTIFFVIVPDWATRGMN